MNTCEYTRGTVHSTDLIEVNAGRRTPFTLCGFHAQHVWLSDAVKFVGEQREAQEAEVRKIADFDHPFVVGEDHSVTHATGVHAPEVFHSDTSDVEIVSDAWEALVGHTGQYGYNGAVMHSSEFIGRDLADVMLREPGTYVITSVEVHSEDDDGNEDPAPAGWCVLRLLTRELTEEETAEYLAGHRSFPGAVETTEGILVPKGRA